MVKCEKCGELYPEEFTHPVFFSGNNYILVDPECALKIKNEIHGTAHNRFYGTLAQETLKNFRDYLNERR